MRGAQSAGWPRAATLLAAVAAGVALGAAGAAGANALSDQPEPDVLLAGLSVLPSDRGDDLGSATVGLAVNNHGTADFQIADVEIPGWTLVEPDAVRTAVSAGRWAYLSFDLMADCSSPVPDSGVRVVGVDGEAVVLERDAAARGLVSIRQRVCVNRDVAAPEVTPTVGMIAASTDPAAGVVHVDIGVVHGEVAELEFELAAVTGHASGFAVELPERLTDLDAGGTTTVTTQWRVTDCGGAAGMTDTGEPDLASSGNFAGLVLHWYWADPARSAPIRTDLPVDLPPEVVVALARFAVTECAAGDAET